MDFETDAEKIVALLKESLAHGVVVGIEAPAILGNGIFVTTVEKITEFIDGIEIQLRQYDSNGYFLPKTLLQISDILKVYRFNSQMVNPYLKDLTGQRFHRLID